MINVFRLLKINYLGNIMTELKILIILHIISAIIFAGYYWLISLKVLPKALKASDFSMLQSFEKPYYITVMIALGIQILTGFRMAMIALPIKSWFDFSNPVSAAISTKFILLGILIVLIGIMKSVWYRNSNLKAAAFGIYLISIVSLLFVWTGVSIRFGGF